MKILNRIMQPMAKRIISLAELDAQMDALVAGSSTVAGQTISEYNALNYSAFYACVKVLSESVAALPLHLYERLPEGGKKRAYENPLYILLHDEPNPNMTAFTFYETLMGHAVSWGNGYAFIEWKDGQVKALWPINPAVLQPKVVNGKLIYEFTKGDGTKADYQREQILHIPGLGFDGIQGYSVVAKARESIGLGIAEEKFGAAFFGNGAVAGGVLEHPLKLSPEAFERLKKSWSETHQGADKAHKVAILEEGMKYNKTSIPPEDAQFLESRQFQVTEMARWFRIPPHLIGDMSHATFSNIEQQSLEFVVYTLMPWLKRWEQAIYQRLFVTDEERRKYFAEFLVDGLLRGDSVARAQFYTQMSMIGALSANDIRALENMNPIEGGNQYFVQLNMVPIDKADTEATTTPDGEPTGEPKDGVTKTGDTAENIAEGEKLNGIQIQAALTVITQLIAGQIPPQVAIELLVAVGIDRDKAEKMIAETKKFTPDPLPTEEPKQEPKAEPTPIKQDSQRSAPNRMKQAQNKLKVVNSYRSVMEDAAQRLSKRQVQDITRALKKEPAEFRIWLDDYYKKQPEVMRTIMTPAFMGLGEAVQKCAAEECGGKVGMTPELKQCMDTHIDLTSKHNSNAAYNRLLKVIGEAEGTRAAPAWEKVVEAVKAELLGWESTIPGMITNWELTRTSGMMSKATYYFSGVREMEWVSIDIEMCPDLDGVTKTLEPNCRTNPFVPKNRSLWSVCEHRGLKDFTPSWNVYTPPLYNGCTCQILPKL